MCLDKTLPKYAKYPWTHFDIKMSLVASSQHAHMSRLEKVTQNLLTNMIQV